MRHRASFLFLLFGCREPTQLDVRFEGRGFTCAPAPADALEFGQLALRVAPQPSDLFGAAPQGPWESCATGPEADTVALGNVVLVPQDDGSGPVEILAVASIGSVDAATCLDDYRAIIEGEQATFDPACIVARRSLGFVRRSSLALTITLDSECGGVVCEASETCRRGECVSAVAECAGADCELAEGGGGAGAGGAGGGGGGGAGGACAGGAGTGDWEVLTNDTRIGQVREVVGMSYEEEFQVVAATADRLVRCAGVACFAESGVTGPYGSVALRGRVGPDYVALGPGGLVTPLGAPELPFFEPSQTAELGVAWGRNGDQDLWWVTQRTATTCRVDLLNPGLTLSGSVICGVAANASGAAVVGTGRDLEVYQGSDPLRAGAVNPATPVPTSGRWSFWIPATGPGDRLGGYALASQTEPAPSANLFAFRPDPSSSMDLLVEMLPPAPEPLAAIAVDESAPETVYAVGGTNLGGVWFGRWTLSVNGNGWEDLPSPPVDAPASLWIGEHCGEPWIAVGGGQDLARARLADVAP